MQGSLLVWYGHPVVAEAFLATQLDGQWSGAFGALPIWPDLTSILKHVLAKG
nr:hypothetical protein [Mycobacterium uberis]